MPHFTLEYATRERRRKHASMPARRAALRAQYRAHAHAHLLFAIMLRVVLCTYVDTSRYDADFHYAATRIDAAADD